MGPRSHSEHLLFECNISIICRRITLSGEVSRNHFEYLWSHFPPCVYTANSKNISIANISIPIHKIVLFLGGRVERVGTGVEGSGREGGINAHILLFLVKILILFAIRVTVVLG